jgi:hypothetical protein
MEHILLRRAKLQNEKSFIKQQSTTSNLPVQNVKYVPPRFEIKTANIDLTIVEYPNIILSNPKRDNVVITLSKPKKSDQPSFLIIKDISGSKKYTTTIKTDDENILIDDSISIQLDQPYESLSLLFSDEDNKFYIY